MGAIWSCCGICEEKPGEGEREPLLPKYASQKQEAPRKAKLPPPDTTFKRIADIFAALKSGKLPSHDQFTHLVQACIDSDVLNVEGSAAPSARYLSKEGKQVLERTKQFLVALKGFDSDKNYDNALQELIFYALHPTHEKPSVPVKVTTDELSSEVPSSTELSSDFDVLVRSLFTLCIHFLTASTFRLILSELLLTLRETTIDAATRVEWLAKRAEAVAEGVEETAHGVQHIAQSAESIEDLKGRAEGLIEKESERATAALDDSANDSKNMALDEADREKWTVIKRFRQVLYQIHEDPQHQEALLTILNLLKKYSSIASSVGVPSVHAELDPDLAKQLSTIRTLIERSASGRPLEPLIRILDKTFMDAIAAPSQSVLRPHLESLRDFFHQCITQPQYLQSPSFLQDASQFYDTTHSLMEAETEFASDLRTLLAESEDYGRSIAADPAMCHLVDAATNLKDSILGFGAGFGRQKRVMQEALKRDFLSWVLPHLLRLLKALPLPRVEFQTNAMDIAIDSAYFSLTTGLAPRTIATQAHTDVLVDFSDTGSRVSTTSRLKVYMDGMKMDVRDVGYFFRYKNALGMSCLGFEDEGLASILLGEEGLTVDMDLEMNTHHPMDQDPRTPPPEHANANGTAPDTATPADPIFRVHDAQISLPELAITIDRSKHWILNKLLVQPVSRPALRLAVANVASARLKGFLEKIGWVGGEIVREAERRAVARRKEQAERHISEGEQPSFWDWYGSVVDKGGLLFGKEEEHEEDQDEEEQDEDSEVHVESHFATTSKGIVRISTTERPDQEPEETAIAVGAGPQLFPDKAGPAYGDDREDLGQAAQGVETDIEVDAVSAVRKGKQAIESAEDEIEGARVRADERQQVEQRNGISVAGWRSDAFNL